MCATKIYWTHTVTGAFIERTETIMPNNSDSRLYRVRTHTGQVATSESRVAASAALFLLPPMQCNQPAISHDVLHVIEAVNVPLPTPPNAKVSNIALQHRLSL